MSDVLPAAPVSAASSSGGGGGASANYQSAPANVVNLPNGLQSISQNITLGARLVGSNPDGTVVLSTAQGNVTLQSPFPLQTGSAIQIQFQAGNPPSATLVLSGPGAGIGNPNIGQGVSNHIAEFEFKVLSQILGSLGGGNLPGLTPGGQVSAWAIGNMPSQTSPLPGQPGQMMASALASSLEQQTGGINSFNNNNLSEKINLLSQFGAPGQVPGQVGQLSLSGKLLTTVQTTLQLLQQQPGSALSAVGADALKTLLPSGEAASPPGQTAQSLLAQLARTGGELPPGTALQLKLLQVIPPGQPVPASAAGTLVGQLSSQTINNLPILQTGQGTLILQAAAGIPPGSTLVFGVVETPPILAAQTTLAAQAQAAMEGNKLNPAMPKLEQALQLLGKTDPQAFQTLMNGMPKMNGQFPASALFFMQALQTGDIKNWLGDKGIQALRRAGPAGAKLLDELAAEFKGAADRTQAAKPGDWRITTLPYLGEYGMANLQLAVRNHFQDINPDERKRLGLDEDAARVTRFVFDIAFSELGAMQIDGLIRPRPDYQKQLDILVRTQQMLPHDIRQNLREIFTESLGAYGMGGILTFQAGYQNWISLGKTQQGGHSSYS